MKDNLFEMLLNLFETSLAKLQKGYQSNGVDSESEEENAGDEEQMVRIKPQHQKSTRVFIRDEQMKLTKASYQFLMRMKLLTILNNELFEVIMNQLHCSDSRIVTLQETKWTIRNVLSSSLTEEQLAFLDLVLYQVEDKLVAH
jgi:uncharacterized protein Smg (DUF494 family)